MRFPKSEVKNAVRRNVFVHRATVIARELGFFVKPDGAEGIARYGHRASVGSSWDKQGRFQLSFLKTKGLKPSDALFDIGCGSLRGGVHFIPYLDSGNYFGIEKQADLLQAGIEHEVGDRLLEEKKPELIVSDSFEFDRFSKDSTFAFAGSVFSHLTADDIGLCLENLRAKSRDGCRFYATYFDVGKSRANYRKSHVHYSFYYTQSEMGDLGRANGWEPEYLGRWIHPGLVTQHLMQFTAT